LNLLPFQGNRVAPAGEFSMKLIPPRLIPLVENHLKDLKKRAGQIAKKTDVEKKVNRIRMFQKNLKGMKN
jgi:hypothetical protein